MGAYNGNLGYLNTGVVNSKLRWEKSVEKALKSISRYGEDGDVYKRQTCGTAIP